MSLKSESEHILNRERLVTFLKSEIMGPCTEGEELDCSGDISFEKWEDAMKPWIQKDSHDEIIKRETPVNRYGIGVLYPPEVMHHEIETSDAGKALEISEEDESFESPDVKPIGKPENVASDSDDFDLSLTNTLQPSSMGISFLAELPEGSEIIVEINAGRYLPRQVTIGDATRTWFFREAISLPELSFGSREIKKGGAPENVEKLYDNGLKLSVECFARPDCYSNDERRLNRRLVTVCLVNRTCRKGATASQQSELTLFQSSFTVCVRGGRILPYPEGEMVSDLESGSERASFRLLYSRKKTFAVGHGCAACWNDASDAYPEKIKADPLPEYEIPSITPDAVNSKNDPLKIPMAVLAGEGQGKFDLLKTFISEYCSWISARVEEIPAVDSNLQETANIHMARAKICADRMENGLTFLLNDEIAERAFVLANRAVLLQQAAVVRKRSFEHDKKNKRNFFNPLYEEISLKKLPEHMGFWRAFQIAFILGCLNALVKFAHDLAP